MTTTSTKDPTFMDEQVARDEEKTATDRFVANVQTASRGARELTESLKLAALTTDAPFSHKLVDRAVMLCAQLSAALGEAREDVEAAGVEW